jgi:glucose-1-phosphate thymidylyltransferase
MQAIILAAGEGQRLRPFTAYKPKSMIKVANRPILEYIINALRKSGVRDIVMVVGYRKERIMDFFGDGGKFGVKIKYALQKQQLGTAHALKQAEELAEDEFFVVPGDNIIDVKTIESATEPYTVVYKRVSEISKYGALLVEDSRVLEIVEKPEKEFSNLANTGIYFLDKDVFKKIGENTSLVSVLNKMIREGYEIKAVEGSEWFDVVYPWDILKINDLSMNFKGKKIAGRVERGVTIIGDVIIGEGSVVRANTYIYGPVIIGEQCSIGPNCVIYPSTSIGDSTSVGPLSFIENCVIGEGVKIDGKAYMRNTVIDSGTAIQANFNAVSGEANIKIGDEWHSIDSGAFIGESCRIGAGVLTKPAATVGNFVSVSMFKVIEGHIPDSSMVL